MPPRPGRTSPSPTPSTPELDKLPEADRLHKEDPLAEQSEDDQIAKVKGRCQARREKLRDYYLTYAAPENLRRTYAELKRVEAQKAEVDKAIPTSMVMQEMAKPREPFILGTGSDGTPRMPADGPGDRPPAPRPAVRPAGGGGAG